MKQASPTDKLCRCPICKGSAKIHRKPRGLENSPFPPEHFPAVFPHEVKGWIDTESVEDKPQPVTRSKGTEATVFALCDEMVVATGIIPARQTVMQACVDMGINPNTASTTFAKWKKQKVSATADL